MELSEVIVTVPASIGGAGLVVVGLAAWLGRVWSERIAQAGKLMGDIDLASRKRRIDAYAALWKANGLLAAWPRATGVTYDMVYELSKTFHAWYYDTGSKFLSRSTHRHAYSPLQQAMADLHRAGRSGALSAADYDDLRERYSTLRSALANDIESRREGPV
jgi:hypothetical protein